MNTDTGKIYDPEEIEEMFGDIPVLPNNFIEVMQFDMTKKQAQHKQVSLKDHRSKLGKQLTHTRRERNR